MDAQQWFGNILKQDQHKKQEWTGITLGATMIQEATVTT
jgi:hypothetical protein